MSALEGKASDGHGTGESPMPADERPPIGRGSARAATKKELTLPATLVSVPQMIEFAKCFFEERGFLPKAQIKLVMIIDEIVSNIAKYAYGPSGGDVTMRLSVDWSAHLVEISFFDEGAAFNPLDTSPIDVKAAVANRTIGGQGILIVKNLADGIEYERRDGKNILRVRVFVEHQSERSG